MDDCTMTAHEIFAQQKAHLQPARLSPAEEVRLIEIAKQGIDPEEDDDE